MAWLDGKRKRDEEEAQRQRAAQKAAREQRTQEQQLKAEERAHRAHWTAQDAAMEQKTQGQRFKAEAEERAYRAHRAAQESLRPASEQKVKTAPLVVNMDTQTNQSAASIASRIPDETERDGFLTEYIAHVKKQSSPNYQKYAPTIGTMREMTDAVVLGGVYADTRKKYDEQIQSRNEAMKTLASGLVMDADGNDMDLSSASLPMVIQSIRADPDSSSRKAKVKALYTLTQMPDNPYSGLTFDEDEANTFLYSADWDDEAYTDAVDEYKSAFYAGSGHDEDNLKTYLELVANINEGDELTEDAYSKRQSRSMRAALDKAWASATGLPAPTDEDIAAWNELNQTAQAEGKKASPFVTWFFGDKDRKAEKESARESAQPEQASTLDQIASTDGVKQAALTASTAPGIALPQEGSKSGGRWFDAAQKQAEEKTEAAQTEAAQAPTAQKEDKRWFDQLYEPETPTPIAQRESVSTPGEAVMMYLRGEPLTQEEHEWLDGILSSNGGKLLLNQKMHKGSDGTLTYGMDYRAKPIYVPGEIPSDVGSWIQQGLDILKSGQLDDATAGAGYLALMQVINDADAWIKSGEVSIPAGKNPYSVFLSTHDSAKAVLQSIREAQIIAIEQQKSAVQAQKQAEEEANRSLVNAVTAGTATPEQIDEYYDRYHRHQYTVLELENRDEGYRIFDRNLSNMLNADDGAYWSSDSAAAQEGLEGEARTEFREVLADEAQSVLHEYADIANSLGMTTQEYLEKCGVTSPDQIADMAYSRMVRRGNEFLNSETAQAGLSSPEDDAATIGVLPAAGAGAAYGVLSTADSLASAPYNMLDALAYKSNVDEIRSSYNGQYGINGRAIYREQLIQYANSGELSEEQSAALLQNIGQVSDIYDIGYKIDNGFIGNGYRAFMGAMDNAQKGLTDFASLGNEFEQNVFNGAASVSGSAAGMLAVGALGAAGTPAMAASAAIYGTQAWNDSYEDALGNGLSKPTAAAIAMGPAVISTVVNAPGAKAEGNLLGGRSLLEQELAKQDALKALTLRGKFAMYAKSLAAEIPKNALSEGLEELEEDAATNLYNAMLYPVALKMDAGEKPQFSDILAGLASVDPAEMMTSGGKSFVGGAAASVVFTLAGYTGMAIRRKLPGYHLPAVTLSQEMMDGTADVTPENLAKVTESLADALQNPEVAQAVNETAQQAQDAQNTAAAAMAGVGAEHFEEGNTQVRMQQEAQTAADAAQQAADAAKSEFEAYSDAVMAGDIDKIKDMQQARVRMGENQKTANEYADTARKHKAAAEDAYAKGLDEARKRGAQISKEQNAQTVAQWQAEFQQMIDFDNAGKEIARMREILKQQETLGFDEGTKQAVEERIEDIRQKREEMATQPDAEIEQLRATVEAMRQANMGDEAVSDYESEIARAEDKKRFYSVQEENAEDVPRDVQTEALRALSERVRELSARVESGEQVDDGVIKAIENELRTLSGEVSDTGEAIAAARAGGKLQSTVEDARGMDVQTRHDIAELEKIEGLQGLVEEAHDITQKLKNGEAIAAQDVTNLLGRIDMQINALDEATGDIFAEDVMTAARTGAGVQAAYDEAQKKAALEKRIRENVAKLDNAQQLATEAEKLTQTIDDGQPTSEKQIVKTIDGIYESLSGIDEDIADILFDEISSAADKAGTLAVALDDAKARDEANAEADYEQYMIDLAQKELEKETYDALDGVAKTMRSQKVYINESQAADILHMTRLKTIPKVNIAYGTRFTQNRADGAIPLDGQFYFGLAEESGGFMDAASLNPAETVMRALMGRRDAYRSLRQKVEEPKDRAQIRRAAKAVMEGDVGKGAEGEQKRTYRGVEVEQAEGKSKPTGSNYGENIYSATKRFAKALGVGIKLGDSRVPDGASGYYQSRVGYAGVDARSASRVDVVIHEIGHALSEKLGLSGTPEMVAALKAENASWAKNYTDAEMAGEAMAEYVWRRVLSDEQGRRFAGDAFTDTFDYQMRQNGYDKAFDIYKNDIRKWLNQSTQDRLQSMVVDRANAKEKETLKEKLLRLTYAFVDSSAPAELINEKIRAETGESTVAFSENLRDAVLLRNKADERALYIIGDGLVARDGSTIIGGSFADAIKDGGLKGKDYKDFELYWLVKDSIDRDKQNKPVFDDGFASTAERRAFIAEKDKTHPEYAKTVDSLLKTWNAFTHEYLVSSGRLDEAGWKYFQSIYPYYAPTYRIKDGDFSLKQAKKAGFSVRQAKGSTELILNPMDSMLEMVGRIVRQDMTNQAAQKLEMLLDTHEGLGEIAHKIETDAKPDKTAQFDPLNGEFGDLIHANVDESGADGQNVITVWHDDGSTSKIEILNEPFFRMMANMPDGGKQVTDFIGRGTRAMTFLTTGANSVFGLRNFARDFQNGVNYGTWAKSYLDGAAKWLMTAYRIKSGDEAVKGYDALGGNDGRIDTTKKGIKDLRHTLYTPERLFHTRDGKWTPLNMEYFKNYDTSTLGGTAKWAGKKLWEYATLQSANEFIEKTTRVAEYLYGKHDLTTAEGRAEAYRASQESTVDFGRKGASSIGRGIRNVVPFMNASLQGVYRTGRQFTAQERGQVVSRVMRSVVNTGLFTAVCAGLRAKFLDDEDKEQFAFLSDDLKNGHFFIPNFAPDVFGDAPLIRIPIDQNPLDYFTHAMVFNALESGKGDEFTIDMATTFATMVDNLNPVGSTIFDPILSTQTNKNWYGSRIVPSYMESWDATTQYTEDTPDAFIGLSRFIKSFTGAEISPMMLQYMAQQYTGFAGQVAIPTLGGDSPVTAFMAYARKMLTSDPLKSNDVVSEVYNANTFLTTVVKAGDNGRELNMLRGDLTPRQAQKAYDVAYDMTHSGGTIYEAKKTISEGYETIKAINARTDLTDEEKYEKSSRIRAKMCELALEVNQEFAKYQEKWVTGESLLTGMLKTLNGGTTIKKQK